MPIESIRRFVLWTGLIVSTFLFVFSKTSREHLELWLINDQHISPDVVLVVIFMIGLLLLFCARLISEGLPKYLPVLRKFLMGNRFIEGIWLDAVFDADEVKHVGIINFKYNNGYLTAKATDYELSGKQRSSFYTIFSKIYDTGDYRYCWEASVVGEIGAHRGYAEYSFAVPFGKPAEFTGEYVSVTRGTKHSIRGDKLTDSLLRALNMNPQNFDPSRAVDRAALIQNYSKLKAGMALDPLEPKI